MENSHFVIETRATTGEGRYVVHDTREALDVYARVGMSLLTAGHLVRFLNAHASHLGAHDVRRMLAPVSDLRPLPNPPSAVAPTDEVPLPPARVV